MFFVPPAFADVVVVPDWVLFLKDYWMNSEISSVEFYNALEYLAESDIIKLSLNPDYDLIANFLISSSLHLEFSSNSFQNCSSDWYITGYFTPIEDDYSGEFQKIILGNVTEYIKSDFVDTVKIEGWGKTTDGYYLGWYDNSFHRSEFALDSHGNYLLPQSVAVDSSIIPQHTSLIIPGLPAPWNMTLFESSDIGPSIIGKHIDVYTGEGKQAELETFRITGENNNVCFEFLRQ